MIHLHNHTTVESLRDAYSKIPELVSRAKELGMDSIAVTGHGSMTSSIEFYEECQKQGLKAILGLEAYFTPDVTIRDRAQTYHLILLAYTQQGYRNLVKLNTEAHQNFYYKPRIDTEILEKYKDGLVCLSACMGSIINTDNGEYWAIKFKEIFGDKFYLEILTETTEDQHQYNRKVVSLADKLVIELVLTSDTHYTFRSQAAAHRHFVKQGKDNDYYPTDDLYLMSEDEAREAVSYLPKETVDSAIANTHVIAEMVNVTACVKGNLMPKYECDNPVEELKNLCRIGWKTKVVPRVPKENLQEYKDRLNYELSVLVKGNYVDYMLIINDILSWCRNNGYLHGFGRGSVGGSLIAYLLGIVALDPIENSLLFERFLNPSRVTQADIDIDLMEREKVLEYLKSKYKHVLQIRTIGYVKDKSALQYAGRGLGFDPKEIDMISKGIEKIDDIADKEKYGELIELARSFLNLTDKWGSHASGYIVTNDDPTDYVSIEKQGEYYVVNQDYHLLEHLGFLKLDLLALSNLGVIHETIHTIPDKIDVWSLPLDDSAVYQQYAEGNTSSIFQVESSLMSNYAKRLKISCFDDIVALLSIGRPAVISSGMADQYIECKDSGEYEYLHPLLEPILSRSHSALIFQEQVMQILQVMAKMSLAEADNARRIMGRKIPEELNQILPGFIQGCKDNGIPEDVADKVTKWIIDSSSYLFNASHAANYSYLSYVTAYLKHYWPLEYMCAVLNNEIGNIDKTVEYIAECKRMNIKVHPPDIFNSQVKHTVYNGGILFGFNALKNVGEITVNKPFDTFEQFLQINQHINKRMIESLIKAGSFDSLNADRAYLLAQLEPLRELNQRKLQCQQKIAENKQLLSEATDEKSQKKYRRQLQQWQKKLSEVKVKQVQSENYDVIKGEFESLGMTFRTIPKVLTGKISRIFSKLDKNEHEMGWITFDTPYGTHRCTVFWESWSQLKDHVKQGETYDFVCDSKGILTELKTPEKIFDFRRKYSGDRR